MHLATDTVLYHQCIIISISVAFWTILGANCDQNDDVVRENVPGKVWRAVNRTTSGSIPENICKINPCIPKCCLDSERITQDGTCRYEGHKIWKISSIPVHKLNLNGSLEKIENFGDHFTVLQGIPCPLGSRYLLEKFKILETGGLFDMAGNIETITVDYCIDYLDNLDKIVGFVCFPPDDKEAVSYRYYPIGMLSSVVFLSATLLVYSLLPELRNIHGLCLMCHMMSLTIGYIFLAVVQLGGGDIPLGLCKLLAYTVVFSFLASFFWLNVMCYDIWWVFSGVGQSQMQASKRGMDSKKFIYYSIYSWGCPTAITILIIAMESSLVSRRFFLPKPEFGKTKCWFQSKVAMWTYFYGPVAAILILNMFYFLTTTHKILKISKETRVLNHDGNKRHDEKEKQRFVLYFKLFLVMGITWVSEVVSFHFNDIRELNFLWTITDIGNTLQGIPIFFIFVWKKKTLRLLNERFCPSINLLETSQASTKTRDTTINNNIKPSDKQRIIKIDSIEMKNLPPESSHNNIVKTN